MFTQKKNFELQINCNTEEAEISRLVIKYVPLNSQIKIEGNELSYSHREPFKNMLKSSATIKQAASEGLLGEFKELEKDEHEYERTKIKEIEDYNKFAYSAMIIEKAKKAGLTPARQKIFTIYKK